MNRYERACQIWAVLAWAASHRQTITYQQLGQATGAFTGGRGQLLEPIQSYCIVHDLPPLTSLVVQQDSGLPGAGFTATTAEELGSAHSDVFGFDWLAHGNPQPEKLEQAVKQRPSNGPQGT